MSGVRSRKYVDNATYEYVTQNGRVVRETAKNGNTVAYTLDFIYDVNGSPFAMVYTTASGVATTFYYALNAQGDVVSLINSYGTVYASYTYDAWGKPLTAQSYNSSYPQLHTVNPLRYRGYYYDNETGWYYLQSRYYDPIVKRFINADGYASTGQGFLGYNMFAYCNNNPVIYCDATGHVLTRAQNVSLCVADTGSNSASSPQQYTAQPQSNIAGVSGNSVGYTYTYEYNAHSELYVHWHDNSGKIIWSRHYSDHGNSKWHENPHDHRWYIDENGNNTQDRHSQPLNPDFKTPDNLPIKKTEPSNNDIATDAVIVLGGAAAGYLVYVGVKWIAATILAPFTGGGSYAFALATP